MLILECDIMGGGGLKVNVIMTLSVTISLEMPPKYKGSGKAQEQSSVAKYPCIHAVGLEDSC